MMMSAQRWTRGTRTLALLAVGAVAMSAQAALAQPACVAMCPGDCDASAGVTVNELVRGVNIALERAPVETCPAMDIDANEAVTIDELLGAVGNLLEGCGPPEPVARPPAALIRNPSWALTPAAEDPFLAARPPDWFCDPSAFGFELLEGMPSLEVDTALCNYLTVHQGIREPVRQGDPLYVSLWHFALTIPSGAIAHMAVAANGCVLWEARRRLPAAAALLEATFPAPFPMPEDTPVYFHIQNHGENTYHLLEISVGGSVTPP